MRKTLFTLFLSLFVAYAFAQNNSAPQHFITDKNPGYAFTLSAVLPGAGEMYNGQTILGLGIFFGDAGLIYSGVAILGVYNEPDYHTSQTLTAGTVLITAGVIVYVGQLVYAPIYSQHWNKKNGFAASKLDLKLKGSQLALAYNF